MADDIMISEYCEAINMRIADDEDVRVINDDLDNPALTLSWPTTAGYQIAGGEVIPTRDVGLTLSVISMTPIRGERVFLRQWQCSKYPSGCCRCDAAYCGNLQ
ncbi:hypothetical protein QW180_17435 [Vibrio sinaloensis]|nr:hypothetical protein [Vibrio sinaloensis]